MLEDFQTGTASMARKRHLASSARGFLCFCLMAQIEVQWVQIRPIRGRKRIHRTGRFILVYRLAIDVRTRKGDDGTG